MTDHGLSPWSAPFVAIDVETTGLDSDPTARVVELAAVRFEDGRPTDRRVATRINPGMPIPAEATAIHGITDADVSGAPTFAEAWPHVVALYDSDFVSTVAYSAAFDRAFASSEVLRASLGKPPLGLCRPWIDPLVWIRKVDRYVRGAGRHRLAATCARRGIVLEQAHAAEDDAIAAGLLWVQLEREIRIVVHEPATHVAVLRVQSALAEDQERDFAEWQRKTIGQGLVAFFTRLRALRAVERAA